MTENITSGSRKNVVLRRNLFDYAVQGKWHEVMELYKQHPWLRVEKITRGGDTALHIAVRDQKDLVVEEMVGLVGLFSTLDEYHGVLESQNVQGNTPLHLAASRGNVSMCECFTKKCEQLKRIYPYFFVAWKDLVDICNEDGETPLFLAARHGKIGAFFCLLCKPGQSDRATCIHHRNNKGETILHQAIAGGHFKLAFLIIERYKDLGSTYDVEGVSPLYLLASQPTAFRSGTRLSLIDKIIYHCIFVLPPGFGDAEKSDDPAERQTHVKVLPVARWNNIKRLLFLIITYIKICINPSSGVRAENATTDVDEETPALTTPEQGSVSTPGQGAHKRNKEDEKKVGLSQRPHDLRNFPVNYDTCFNFIMLLNKAILCILFLGLGRSYVNKIRHKKGKHFWSAKILEILLDEGKGHSYDCTGKEPLYKDRAILYEGENIGSDQGGGLSHEISEMHPESGNSSKEVQRSGDLMHKLLQEAQRSADLVHKLLQVAETNRLPPANDMSQKWHNNLEEDVPRRIETSVQADYVSRRIETPIQAEYVPRRIETSVQADYVPRRIETPILVAAKNGISEIVEKILQLYPESILDVDVSGKNAVMLAAEHRQTQLYEKLVSQKLLDERAFHEVDDKGNTALHLAATLSDYQPYRFAALQMQWEIKWYKYVKNSVPQHLFSRRNKANKTPKDVFREAHEGLVEKGGQWLSSTSNSCSVVATLITTVAFATTASVPGGMKENSSRPNLEQHPGFLVFAVSSLIGLCFSVASVITFLVILTSRYHQKDFKRDLPRKLLLGLTSLFISLGAMLVCFCAGHYFLLKDKLKLGAFPLYALACVPVIFFAIMQFPFYFDLILATFKKVPPRTPSG